MVKAIIKILFILLPFVSVAQNPMQSFFALNQTDQTVTYDADAQDYIDRVEATGRTLTGSEKGYFNTFFIKLKTDGVWNDITDAGPTFLGTSAASLVTLKGATTATAVNSPTFSSSGVDFNGTNQYINTGINSATSLTVDDTHIGFYSREAQAASGSQIEMGNSNAANTIRILFALRLTTFGFLADHYNASGNGRVSSTSPGTSAGFFVTSRTANNSMAIYFNGASQGTQTGTDATASLNSLNIYVGAYNSNGSAQGFSTKQCAYWSVGSGLTSTQVADYNNAVEALLDSFGIGVQ